MDYGIQIYLPSLKSISIAKDKKSVTVGGGTNSKNLIDALWAAKKQTGKPFLTKQISNSSLTSE
jgi:hypothetical protein